MARTAGAAASKAAKPRARAPGRAKAPGRSALARSARRLGKETLAQIIPAEAHSLLEQDHREAESLFDQFERDVARRAELALRICLALTVHALIEEEIFYPAARAAGLDDLLDEAEVEHAAAKQLIAEIEKMRPADRLFAAKVKVLGEYVRHHIDEEETKLFPALAGAGVDAVGIGERLLERRIVLLAELAPRY